jgi:hypothetical protein
MARMKPHNYYNIAKIHIFPAGFKLSNDIKYYPTFTISVPFHGHLTYFQC